MAEKYATRSRIKTGDPGRTPTATGPRPQSQLETLGTLLVRAPVEHGARRLQCLRHAWDSFPHDHARSRAYRWGEDGLGGISDRHQYICFALALWNGKDPILKERLFGLTGNEGNHGEDVKEYYFYLDSTPTHSYMKYPLQVPASGISLRAAG